MKNETDRQITRHSLPTRMCFNFFTHRTKILKFYCQPTNGTFAFAPTHEANPSVLIFLPPHFFRQSRLATTSAKAKEVHY